MNDEQKIFELYLESTASSDQPQMTQDAQGNKEWWLHGKRHREDGPAIEYANGSKEWYLHDRRHREDGAAVEWANGYKSWWLHGKRYATPEAWAKALLVQRHQPHDAQSVGAFLKQILKKDVDEAI